MTDLIPHLLTQLPADRSGLAIVFYHVDGATWQHKGGGNAIDYAKDIAISVPAARAIHPDATVILLTDATTPIHQHDGLHIVRLPLGTELGMERTRAQIAFSHIWGGHALHLDTDMELRRTFSPLFQLDFDFAFTWRPEVPHMQINGGMFLVCQPKAFVQLQTAVLKLIPAIADAYHEPSKRTAYGEQMALHMLWEHREPARVHPSPFGRMGVLPCSVVNYTYREGDSSPAAERAMCWHRKGGLKAGATALPAAPR